MSKWKTSQIKDFGRVITGYTPSTSNSNYWLGEIPFYSPSDFNDEVYCNKTERAIKPGAISNDRVVTENSLMVTCIASIGKIALATKRGITNQQINSILFNETFDPKYCYYLIKHNINELIKLGGTTAVPIVNKADFEKIFLKHHSEKTEQQHIAKILSTCDAVIEKTQAAIAKYKVIKQGMLQDLFTRGIDTTTNKLRPRYQDAPHLYKESKLGMIPVEWDVDKIDLYVSFLRSGLSRLLSDEDIGIPVLISGNIQEGCLDFTHLKYWYENDPQGADTNLYKLNTGDILICFINSLDQIGKSAIFKGFKREVIYTTNLLRLKASSNANPTFLFYLMNSNIVQSELQKIVKPAVNQASFTTKDFLKIPVPIIEEPEQKLIAERLTAIDNKLQTEQTYLQKQQQIKKGLMEDLLSGRKKVNIEEELPQNLEAMATENK
jgi:type I restriction enzyme, S subunit